MNATPAVAPAHAKPVSRRDHLWVLVVIAAFALYDVWGAWTELGNKSGFAHGTGWTLTVIVEAYWGYALYAWLVAASGRRSRRFAMASAGAVFALSLAGQAASHLTAHRVPPAAVVVLVSTLPVIVLALTAFLIHLRHIDRAEATAVAEAEAEKARCIAEADAKADERVALRGELAAVRDEMRAAETARNEATQEAAFAQAEVDDLTRKAGQDAAAYEDRENDRRALIAEVEALKEAQRAAEAVRDEARQEAEDVRAKAEKLTRKVASLSGSGRTRTARARRPAKTAAADPAAQFPDDFDAEAEALAILAREPGVSGAKLGLRVGRSERWGQLFKSGYEASPGAEDDTQRTAVNSDGEVA